MAKRESQSAIVHGELYYLERTRSPLLALGELPQTLLGK